MNLNHNDETILKKINCFVLKEEMFIFEYSLENNEIIDETINRASQLKLREEMEEKLASIICSKENITLGKFKTKFYMHFSIIYFQHKIYLIVFPISRRIFGTIRSVIFHFDLSERLVEAMLKKFLQNKNLATNFPSNWIEDYLEDK